MIDRALCLRAAQECACLHLRKASRVVTQWYDETLAPSGIRCTQLAILLSVKLMAPVAPSELAEELVMDRSTLTRNLQPLVHAKLLKLGPGPDRRSRQVTLTAAGEQTLQHALQCWNTVQQQFVSQLDEHRWKQILGELAAVVDATRRKDNQPTLSDKRQNKKRQGRVVNTRP